MKKIQLNSIILYFGINENEKLNIFSKFNIHEIIDYDNISNEIIGYINNDINHVIYKEIKERSKLKLSLGQRIFINYYDIFKRNVRFDFIDLAKIFDIPIYYLIGSNENCIDERKNNMYNSNIKFILNGDNYATVINLTKDDYQVIKNDNNLFEELSKNYKGIKAIGDVHGNYESMKSAIDWANSCNLIPLFLGDIVDYGPFPLKCIDYLYDLMVRNNALSIIGNHEQKLFKTVNNNTNNNNVPDSRKITLDQINNLSDYEYNIFRKKFNMIINSSKNHIVIGNVCFTHGAVDNKMFDIMTNRLNGKLLSYALYGQIDKNSPMNENQYPNRIYDWTNEILSNKIAVVGHDIRDIEKPFVYTNENNGISIFVDTGSSKGGKLSSVDLLFGNDNNLIINNFNSY